MTQQFTYMPNLELRLTVTVRFYTSLPVCVCSNTQYLFDCHLGWLQWYPGDPRHDQCFDDSLLSWLLTRSEVVKSSVKLTAVARSELVWSAVTRSKLVWSAVARSKLVWSAVTQSKLVWSALARSELVWSAVTWSELYDLQLHDQSEYYRHLSWLQ